MYILMITDNAKDEAKIALDSFRLFSDVDDAKLIVVDNYSTDGSRELFENEENIIYVYMDEGKCSPANIVNAVINELNIEENLLIMGQPYAICPHTLSTIENILANDEVGIVSGMGNTFWGYQPLPNRIRTYNDLLDIDYDRLDFGETINAISVASDVLCIKGELLNSLGELCDDFLNFRYVIDDYCLRVISTNKKIKVAVNSYFWQPCSKMSVGNESNESIDNDLKLMEDRWGIHYFNTFGNKRLVSMIQEDTDKPIKVLEIGCDCGGTLNLIKNIFPDSEIYGTDINPASVEIAKSVCTATVDNIEDKNIPFKKNYFDYIIFGDVLEHLRNPLAAVEYCRELLTDGGCIIASIPNVMHYSVMYGLLNGNFTYTEQGLLDKTHIHLFTYKEILRMFEAAEYNVEHVQTVVMGSGEEIDSFIDQLMQMSNDVERHMYETFQYVVRARKK